MSAPDPTPTHSDLPADARLQLRLIVERAVAGTIDDGELHTELRALAAGARADGITPERCLIALRQTWASLPRLRMIDDAARLEALQWRLVSQLIGAYYHDGSSPGDGKDPPDR